MMRSRTNKCFSLLLGIFFYSYFIGAVSASSPDLTINLYSGNPVLKYSGTGWYQGNGFDSTRVSNPRIIKINGTYYMYYYGMAYANDGHIGVATSVDGINWVRFPTNPIIRNINLPGWSTYEECPAAFMYDNNVIRAWIGGKNLPYGGIWKVVYSESTDGYNYIFSPSYPLLSLQGHTNVINSVKFKGQYLLYLMDNSGFYYANSADGINFNVNEKKVVNTNGLRLFGLTTHSYQGREFIFTVGYDLNTWLGYYGYSTDGVNFTFHPNPITNGYLSNHFLLNEIRIEDGLIKFWGGHSVGNITWAYGNDEIWYGTIPEPDWGFVFGNCELFSDNFDDNYMDPNKWNSYLYRVTEESGIMKVTADVTDQYGLLQTKWIEFDPAKSLTITRKVKQHYANNYYDGRLWVFLDGATDYTFGLEYVNFEYPNPSCPPTSGFYLTRNYASHCSNTDSVGPITPVWDTWYNEKIVYNPVSGLVEYFVNDIKKGEINVGVIPNLPSYKIKFHFDAHGWWTGHYVHMDDFKVSQCPTPLPNQPPVLSPIGNQSIYEGQTLQFIINAIDHDGNTLTYSASNLPAGAIFDPITKTFTWTPTFDQQGNYTNILFKVTDDDPQQPLSASESITISVNNINRPPVIAPIGDKTALEGQLLQFTVAATDPDGNPLTYTASNLPDGAVFDHSTQTFRWTPSFNQAGNYPNIEFTVMDNGSPMEVAVQLITITVGNVNRAPVFTAVGTQQTLENQLLQFSIGATDYDGDIISYSSGPLPSGASFNSNTKLFSWTPTNTQAGTYVVNFYASDNSVPTASSSMSVVINVGDVPTPSEMTNTIINTVVSLNLTKTVENSYMANLKKIIPFVEGGQTTPAINQLNAFIQKIQNDILQGKIGSADGTNLIIMANELIAKIQG